VEQGGRKYSACVVGYIVHRESAEGLKESRPTPDGIAIPEGIYGGVIAYRGSIINYHGKRFQANDDVRRQAINKD